MHFVVIISFLWNSGQISVACAIFRTRQHSNTRTSMKLQLAVIGLLVLLAAMAVNSFPHRGQVNSDFVLLRIATHRRKMKRVKTISRTAGFTALTPRQLPLTEQAAHWLWSSAGSCIFYYDLLTQETRSHWPGFWFVIIELFSRSVHACMITSVYV